MPFFSVIIPTYNRATLINGAIDSVLAQKFTNFELIIVDDGSTDNTKEVVDTYTDERINYVYQENGERGKARNVGVRNAKGKYVFFLDSDDLIYPNHLQHAYEKITALNCPVFFHVRYGELYPDGRFKVKPLSQTHLQKNILRQNKFACQFFLIRETALQFPFSEDKDLKIGEDWEVVLKIAVRHKLYFSNEPLGAIVHHGNRSMEIASAETLLKSFSILHENLKKDPEISTSILGNVRKEFMFLASLSAAIDSNKKQSLQLWMDAGAPLFKRRTLAIFKKLIFGGKA